MADNTTSRGKNYSIIAVLGMFSFLTALSGSSTNLAIPKIAIDMDISSSMATWIVQIGLITTAILLVMFGHIGDILSKNVVFLAGDWLLDRVGDYRLCAELSDYFIWPGDSSDWIGDDYGQLNGDCHSVFS